jgi:hypothetical protein
MMSPAQKAEQLYQKAYTHTHDTDQARQYAIRAVESNPFRAKYWSLLGEMSPAESQKTQVIARHLEQYSDLKTIR